MGTNKDDRIERSFTAHQDRILHLEEMQLTHGDLINKLVGYHINPQPEGKTFTDYEVRREAVELATSVFDTTPATVVSTAEDIYQFLIQGMSGTVKGTGKHAEPTTEPTTDTEPETNSQ